MAEWPVVLKGELDDVQRGEVEPGKEVTAVWARIRHKYGDIDERGAIWIICPRCGTLGHCPRKGSRYDHGASWEITDQDGSLTMRPSILCNSTVSLDKNGQTRRSEAPCGGHYWLTNGVLREV